MLLKTRKTIVIGSLFLCATLIVAGCVPKSSVATNKSVGNSNSKEQDKSNLKVEDSNAQNTDKDASLLRNELVAVNAIISNGKLTETTLDNFNLVMGTIKSDAVAKTVDIDNKDWKKSVKDTSIIVKQLLSYNIPYNLRNALSSKLESLLGDLSYLKSTCNIEIEDLPKNLELPNQFSLSDITWDSARGNSDANIYNGGYVAQSKECLYFKGWNTNKLCRVKLDGSNAEYMYIGSDIENANESFFSLNVLNGVLSYARQGYNTTGLINCFPSNISLDTCDNMPLYNKGWGYLTDKVYWNIDLGFRYYLFNKSHSYTSVRLKDKNSQFIMAKDSVESVYIKGDYVYYQVAGDLLRADLSGNNVEFIVGGTTKIQFADDYVYYYTDKHDASSSHDKFSDGALLYRINLKTKITEVVMKAVDIYNVNGNYIYYVDELGTSICRYKINSIFKPQKLNKEVLPSGVGSISILPSGVYCVGFHSNCIRVECDGSLTDFNKLKYEKSTSRFGE